MAKKGNIARSEERFTDYAVAVREAAREVGLVVRRFASPAEVELRARCQNAAEGWWKGIAILTAHLGGSKAIPVVNGVGWGWMPDPPARNNRPYQGNPGSAYQGPSKKTLNKRAAKARRKSS